MSIAVDLATVWAFIIAFAVLVYVVMDSGVTGQSGSRYGKPASTEPYHKPVILVSSRERLEEELPGQNETDLYQLHYADPVQVTNLLDQLDLRPSTASGASFTVPSSTRVTNPGAA